jgi:cyclophilin family peptidyl-prolyl cis-trans isomerase
MTTPPATMAIPSSPIGPVQPTPVAQTPAEKWPGPQVRFETTMGNFVVSLDMVGAPKTAASFLKTVKAGHFNNARVFRIEPNFLIQLGDQDATGKYRPPPFPPVPLETTDNHHEKYALGMAHGDLKTAPPQSTWYIDLGSNSSLNAEPGAAPNTTGFAAFGHVIEGFDVVDAIGQVETAATGGPFPGKLPKVPVIFKRAIALPVAPAGGPAAPKPPVAPKPAAPKPPTTP